MFEKSYATRSVIAQRKILQSWEYHERMYPVDLDFTPKVETKMGEKELEAQRMRNRRRRWRLSLGLEWRERRKLETRKQRV